MTREACTPGQGVDCTKLVSMYRSSLPRDLELGVLPATQNHVIDAWPQHNILASRIHESLEQHESGKAIKTEIMN